MSGYTSIAHQIPDHLCIGMKQLAHPTFCKGYGNTDKRLYTVKCTFYHIINPLSQVQVSGLPIPSRSHLSCYLHKSRIDLSILTFYTSHGAGQHNKNDFPKIPKRNPPMVSIRVPQHIHAIGIQKLQAETIASALLSFIIFKNLLFFIIILSTTLSLDEILYQLVYYRHKTISCTCQTTFHFYTLCKKS